MIDNNIIRFINEHLKADIRSLALQANRYPDMDMNLVLRQIAGKQIACEKIPSWHSLDQIIYPIHLSLEQCSSEETAKYKSSLCSGDSLVDLTGGFGVDISFMARNFKHATYVEKQTELTSLAKHNFDVLNLKHIDVVNDEAETFLSTMPPVDCIYIDPARRNNSGKKMMFIEDCTPSVIDLEKLIEQKCSQAIIKLSPMLDISAALKSLNNVSDVHIVSLNNECKELIFVKKKDFQQVTMFHCINIHNNGHSEKYTFLRAEEEASSPIVANKIGQYLYEPNTSIMKAGAYKKIASDFNLQKLHINSHLYTSEYLNKDFPGRKFAVKNHFVFNKKELRKQLKGIEKVNITTRNFPLSVAEIRSKTSLKDGGDIYIFATTALNEKKILIVCEKI